LICKGLVLLAQTLVQAKLDFIPSWMLGLLFFQLIEFGKN